MLAYGLYWLPVKIIYFDPPSKTVVVAEAWKCSVCVVEDAEKTLFLHCESTLHALPKDENSRWN